MDERLRWKPAGFNNITELIVEVKHIWKPEFAVINGFVWKDWGEMEVVTVTDMYVRMSRGKWLAVINVNLGGIWLKVSDVVGCSFEGGCLCFIGCCSLCFTDRCFQNIVFLFLIFSPTSTFKITNRHVHDAKDEYLISRNLS